MGPVQDIVASVVNERNLLFVLHLDGHLRIWDNQTKLLNYNVHSNDIEGNAIYSLPATLVILSFCIVDHWVMVLCKHCSSFYDACNAVMMLV